MSESNKQKEQIIVEYKKIIEDKNSLASEDSINKLHDEIRCLVENLESKTKDIDKLKAKNKSTEQRCLDVQNTNRNYEEKIVALTQEIERQSILLQKKQEEMQQLAYS